MKLDPAIIKQALKEAISQQIADVALVGLPEAARLLDVSPETAKRLLVKGVDVKGKGAKVRIADIRRVIAERTIKL